LVAAYRNESSTSQTLEVSKQQPSGLPTPPDSTDSHEHPNAVESSSIPKRPIDLLPGAELSTESSPPVASTSKTPKSSPHDESQPASYRSTRASKFRHVPPRNARTSTTSSHLGPQHHTPAHSRNVSVSSINKNNALLHDANSSAQSTRPTNSRNEPTVDLAIPSLNPPGSKGGTRHQLAAISVDLILPAADAPITQHTLGVSSPNTVLKAATSTSSSTSVPTIPYRYQPEGFFRLITDNFVALRQAKQEGGDGKGHGMKRAEKRKLERRLEKLIAIHFPLPSAKTEHVIVPKGNAKERPGVAGGRAENRRVSSFVDFDVRSITIQDAGGLWRGIFGSDDTTTIRGLFTPSIGSVFR
jgi:rabenosyn-5